MNRLRMIFQTDTACRVPTFICVLIRFSIRWVLLSFLIFITTLNEKNLVNAQTIAVSRYSYLTQVAAGQLQLNQINPINPNDSFSPISITTGSESKVFATNSSPDGKWIAIWSYSPSNLILQLYNVNSAIVSTVIQVNWYEVADDRDIMPVWSPNSQYFAFNVYNASLPTTYLFPISNLTLTTIVTTEVCNEMETV